MLSSETMFLCFTRCFIFFSTFAAFHSACAEEEWVSTKRADPKEIVNVTLALKQINTEWLDETLAAVSYPDSPRYGHYMSLEEIVKHVHADPEGVEAVKAFLQRHTDIQSQFTVGDGFAKLNMPVSTAEDLFSARFYHYQHIKNPSLSTIRTLTYSVPQAIAPYVEFSCCIDQLPSPNQVGVLRSYDATRTAVSVSPSSIRSSYEINDYITTNSSTTQAIAGFLKQYFSPSDLEKFQKKFEIPSNPIAKVIGKNSHMLAGGEASLDVQYITAVGQKAITWFISTSTYSNKGQEDFLSWLMILVNTTDIPLVHSVSYGDYENTIEQSYMMRCEQEFKKLGIMGLTILFASGDSGVNCHGEGSKFRPNWPASSPSITVVGGAVTLEEVWSDGGGGFSNVFPMPDYQSETVKNWLQNGDPPPSKYFNSSGRAYPDVSAYAVNFEIIVDGGGLPVDGTSCAAPTTAGVVSLLNDVRFNSGKSSLGFLNPMLYKTLGAKGFFDITKGKNSGGGLFCPGFKAVKGWDPASGWGSPNFKLLKELVNQ